MLKERQNELAQSRKEGREERGKRRADGADERTHSVRTQGIVTIINMQQSIKERTRLGTKEQQLQAQRKDLAEHWSRRRVRRGAEGGLGCASS